MRIAPVPLVLNALFAATLLAAPASAQPRQQQEPFAQLHDALNLNPGQEPAWRAYVDASPSPEAIDERRRTAAEQFPQLGSPRRVDIIAAEMQQELNEFKRQSEALKLLYARLSPAQQRIFDDETLPRGGPQDDQRGGPQDRR